MLGFVFAKLMPMRSVTALNVLSALLTSIGVGVLSLAFNEILRRLRLGSRPRRAVRSVSKRSRKKAQRDPDETVDVVVPSAESSEAESDVVYASLAALFVGLTATWWNQANGFEVYSLHALLISLVLYLFLRYIHRVIDPVESAADDREATRLRRMFPLTLGLAFTNHLTVVLLAPAFLVYFGWSWSRRRTGDSSFVGAMKEIGRLVPGFIIGLAPYLYLPLRAAQDPLFNWGDPDTLKRFIDHVAGKQYSVWFMQGGDVFGQQTSYFFSKLPTEVGVIGLIIAALGIALLAKLNARLAVFSALIFVTCLIWAGGYDILEIEPYYMLAILTLGIWCAAGARWIADRAGRNAAFAAMGALVAIVAFVNFSRSNERTNTLVEDMTVNVLTTLPKDAVVISSQWDFWVSGSWYMQAVEKLRPDVAVIDHELLRRSWYLDQMMLWYPAVMGPIESSVKRFRAEVLKFEHGEDYDPVTIQSAYTGMIDAIIDSSYAHRPVYVSGEVQPEIGGRYNRVPNHLMLRLTKDSTYIAQSFPTYRFRTWSNRVDHYAAKTYELYAKSSYARALYEAEAGKTELAKKYYEHALSFDPQWTRDDVKDQSLNSEEQTYAMIDFFQQLRAQRPQ
ncbi:MAG: DUF2723 domain-containing protein, partial [bacterium]|nr:DUF2723 domain-containing protein [Candidatus Kapabacteria bacterium]